MQFLLSSFQNAPKAPVLHGRGEWGGGEVVRGRLAATVIPSLVLDTCNVIYMPLFLQIIRRFLWRLK